MPEELSVTNVVHSLLLVVMTVGVEVVAVVKVEVEEAEVMKTAEVEEVTIMMVAVVAVEMVTRVVVKEGMRVVMDRALPLLPLLMVVLVVMHPRMHMVETIVMLLIQSLHLQVILGEIIRTRLHMVPRLVMVATVKVETAEVEEGVHLVDMVEVLETQVVMAVLQQRFLKRSSNVTKIVGILVIMREFTYQICLQMSPLMSSENFLEVSAK